jgi:hypothetical protein
MKSKQALISILGAVAISIALSGIAMAQEITGTIVGTVKDTAGAVVPGATVTITDPSKDNLVVRTITTDDDGGFSAPNLASSVYEVSVEAANFKKSVNTNIKVDVGQRRLVDVVLTAGRIDETVTVEADPVAVDTTSATNGTVISGDQVREIPINNRNFVQLVTLAPGVTNDLSDQIYTGTTAVGFENGNSATTAQASQPNTVQISVNGARSSQNTFTVDGADITDRGSNLTIQAYPSVDSIGEFRVLRSLYPAESGRSGGGQVNVITRSGTKDFRGSVFGFVRNEIFNANDFFSNQIAPVGRDEDGKAKRKPFRYLNAGWTLGGPIYFLKFGERDDDDDYFGRWDKTFFFFSQEFRRDRRSPTLFSTMPYDEMRRGIFRVPICVQVTAGTCTETLNASAATPLSLTTVRPINPVSAQYLGLIYQNVPANTNPTNFASPTAAANFTLNYPTPNEADFRQEIIKIDHSFSEEVNMFYRYQRDKIPTLDANAIFSSGSGIPFVSTTETESPGRTHTVQLNYVPSSNLIFEGRYTFGYGAILSRNVGLLALDRSPIQPPLPYANQRDRVPSVAFAQGWSNLGGFGPYDNFSWKGNIAGTMTWINGNHNMKFGLVYSKYRKNENALAGVNEGQFSGFNTPGATAATIAPGGNLNQQIFANFLLGTNATFTQARFDYTADLRQITFEGFAQDEWRVRPNMTVYFGVRYSFFGSPYDRNGRLTNFVPELWQPSQAPAVTGAGTRVVGTGNFCNGIIANTQNFQTLANCTPLQSPWGKHVIDVPKNDFAPRVGIAWDPFSKGETSIRAGYGIYHEQVLNGPFLQNIGTNSPYQQTCTLTGINISNPDPAAVCTNPAFGFGIAQTIRSVQSDWETPYMQHWSLDVQQQLTRNTLLTVGYYGSKGTNLIGAFEMNLVPAGTAIARGATGCATGSSYFGQPGVPTLGPCQAPNTPFVSAASSNILDQIRPFRGYRGITMIQPRFDSNYHSLQVSGQHRFTGSSQLNLAYTWGKNLTNSQNDRTAGPQNTYNVDLEWGRAALDRRHVFSANYIYELPFYRDQRGFVGKVLGGWQASGIVTFNTGLPLTPVTSNLDQAGLGIIAPASTVARPNVVCDPNQNAPHTPQQWFNTACFMTNAQSVAAGITRVGDAGRGIIEGPSTRRVDFTMAKNLRFTETFSVQLRAEVFNVFNWVNYRGVSLNITAANFGQVISTRDPRTMQFGAKIYF